MNQKLQTLRTLANRTALRAGVATGAALMAVQSHAAGIDDLFAEVDIAGIATKVTALAVVIVGIALMIKGPSIVKRIIAKI